MNYLFWIICWWMAIKNKLFWACHLQLQVLLIRKPLYLGLRPQTHWENYLDAVVKDAEWVCHPCLFWRSSRFLPARETSMPQKFQPSSVSLCCAAQQLSSSKYQHSQYVQWNAMICAESYKLASQYRTCVQLQHQSKNDKYFTVKFGFSRKVFEKKNLNI